MYVDCDNGGSDVYVSDDSAGTGVEWEMMLVIMILVAIIIDAEVDDVDNVCDVNDSGDETIRSTVSENLFAL